jgi:predicted metal-dependent hydrolase
MSPRALAQDRFRKEVLELADRVGVTVREVRIRPMTRKWASASTAGRLTFNTALLTQPRWRREEVMVHELVHLKVPNHGRLFRSLVRAYLGENDWPDGLERRISIPAEQRASRTG